MTRPQTVPIKRKHAEALAIAVEDEFRRDKGMINRRVLDPTTDTYGVYAYLCEVVPSSFLEIGKSLKISDYMSVGILKSYGTGLNDMLKSNYIH